MARVVVVEDEEIVRKVLHSLLVSAGHEVTRFDDGAAFIESADQDSAELIITDLAMPTPGEEVIQSVRERGLSIPIIVLTGILDNRAMDHLMEIGADRVIEKPIRAATLISMVELLVSTPEREVADR